MILRKIEKRDLVELFEIHKKFYDFPFPDINNPLYAFQQIITDDSDKIVMAAFARLTSEGIFITNKDIHPLTRMNAIKLMLDTMLPLMWEFGLEDCHAFVEHSDVFINIMRKFGFVENTGYPMVRLK